MKKLALLFSFSCIALWAADVWVAKPFTEWADKDVIKILTDSPWSKKVSIESAGGPAAPAGGGGGGGRGGGRGGGPQGGADIEAASGGGGGGRGGGGGGADIGGAPGGGAPSQTYIISFRSALPVKQALLKQRYGAEVGTSADAKAMLERQEEFYVVAVAGLRGGFGGGGFGGGRGDGKGKGGDFKGGDGKGGDGKGFGGRGGAFNPADMFKPMLMPATMSVKGKDTLNPQDVQVGQGSAPGTFDAYLLFPRKVMYSADDKELEIAFKMGNTNVKAKFKLKDMMFKGKLEM